MNQSDDLDRLDSALLAVMRIAKRPSYWEEFQRRADTQIDRPAAAILMMLANHPLQFSEVVAKLGIEAPSISRKVHELEEDGLIAREPMLDRRVHLLALSGQGQALATKILNVKRSMLKDALSDWTNTDTRQLSELLTRLAQDLSLHFGAKEIGKS